MVEAKVECENRWRAEPESPAGRRTGQRFRVEVSSQATTPETVLLFARLDAWAVEQRESLRAEIKTLVGL